MIKTMVWMGNEVKIDNNEISSVDSNEGDQYTHDGRISRSVI